MARINEAFEVLGDPARRAAYDRAIGVGPAEDRRPQMQLRDDPPPGFALYEALRPDLYAQRVGDRLRGAWSLRALGTNMSGLSELADDELWLLDLNSHGVTDDDVLVLRRFKTLETLKLGGTRVTDRVAELLTALPKLRQLDLADCAVTDAVLEQVATASELEELVLFGTQVTDVGLRTLAFHPALRILDLRRTRVTEACLPTLVSIPKLRELRVPKAIRKQSARFCELRPDVTVF